MLSGLREPGSLSCIRGQSQFSCAKREIPAIKKSENYSEKFYTVFPEGKIHPARFFLSPVVNWMEKTRSQVNRMQKIKPIVNRFYFIFCKINNL
jgi:hypothetical protein